MGDLSDQLERIAWGMTAGNGIGPGSPMSHTAFKRIHELHKTGLNPRQIAETLDKEGVTSPTPGNKWRTETVRKATLRKLK